VGWVSDCDRGRQGSKFLSGCQQKAPAFIGFEALGKAAKFHCPAEVAADPIVV